MEEELKCKVCGKLASEDNHFYKGRRLCNRHFLQYRNHGKFLDHDNIQNPNRHIWTKEEEVKLEQMYKDGRTIKEIAKYFHMNINAISAKASAMNISSKYMKPNNPKFKAPYQDYDWCYERFVNKRMSHEEMAKEAGTTKRTIQKWCVEKHGIHARSIRSFLKLTDIQRELIIAGTLGDGHIDRRETQPMYIESHAEDEKDYLFWKYNILKNLCNKPPVYMPAQYGTFGGDKQYLCKPTYRFCSKIIDDLLDIRNMSRLEKIKQLTEFQLSLLLLDDGNRDNLWHLCVAEWTDVEIEEFIRICADKFNYVAIRNKDPRYLYYNAVSSKQIDNMILKYIPNNLDIIKKKITNNNKIRELSNYTYIVCKNGNKIGVSTYCKTHHISDSKGRNAIKYYNQTGNTLKENEFLKCLEDYKNAI